ncbi:Uncharacterised protein [uncultured archaeon]|nr:Uncharacterised protein [uncultured archaeon]
MNSIDAIIALLALTAAFGIIIGAINEQKGGVENAKDSIKANTLAKKCGTIIDSIYSNAAEKYSGEIKCDANGNIVLARAGLREKNFEIITTAKMTSVLEVQTSEHYK